MEKQITFKDLIMQVEKDHALTYLIDNMRSCDCEMSSKDIYEKGSKVFEALREMKPAEECDMELSVWHGLAENHDVGFDVSGYGYNEWFGDKTYQDIEGLPWNEWLAMPVKEDTLKELTPAQIVGYSMFEMTFLGWTEEEIQDSISKKPEQKD